MIDKFKQNNIIYISVFLYEYIEKFKRLGVCLFVHFGLYSVVGKGEWYLHLNPKADKEKYNALKGRFNVKKTWANDLVKTAKAAGANISRLQLAITTDFRFTIRGDLTISTRAP